MKRHELVKKISKKTKIPIVYCDMIIDGFRDVVCEALAKGENEIIIRGFLSFETTGRKERYGYNPKTGGKELYMPVKTVKCKPSQILKDAVKNINGE